MKMFRRSKGEDKAKLEHKLYLARENPEPVFDLTDCNLKNVPHGIYSLCKVFRKEKLLLQNNCLTSLVGGGKLGDLYLLKVLDLHQNAFTSLPEDICLLTSLQELYVNANQLKKLPNSISTMTKLKILDVSSNNLKYLPEEIGDLVNLEKFNITGNKCLSQLPKSIARAQRLVLLELDGENYRYPPPDIATRDTEVIKKFICEDMGTDYIPPDQIKEITPETSPQDDVDNDTFKAKIWELENIKQQRLQYFLELEKENELLQQQEFELASAQKVNRDKLLANIAEEQNKFDLGLTQLQHIKEVDRFRLVEQLREEELNADIAIKQLLEVNREPLTQLLEQEKMEEYKFLTATTRFNETLRKDDILAAMRDMLEQETASFQQFHQRRFETNKSILEQEMESNNKVSEVLQYQDLHKAELVSTLLKDSELQKAAVGTLLERGDARSWGLVQQVRLVESQLAALTHIEMDRKKLKLDHHVNDLAEKRVNLSMLLVDLLDKQQKRRAELLKTLEKIESDNDQEDFWLRQYQILLDRLPIGLAEAQKNMDPALANALLANGVLHCLPFLAKITQSQYNIEDISEHDLSDAGITNRLDRLHVMDAFKTFKKETSLHESPHKASSSKIPVEEPSAPNIKCIYSSVESECVICLDRECQVIFVPCGHLSCCDTCSESISECPLCRVAIERKIYMAP